MTLTPVGLNQNTYVNTTIPTVNQQTVATQPIPVGQSNLSNTVATTNNGVLNNLPQSTNSYENDIIMNSIDFNKAAQDIGLIPQTTVNEQPQTTSPQQQTIQPQTVQPQQTQGQVVTQQPTTNPQVTNPQQPAFTGKALIEQTPNENSDLTNCLVNNKSDEKKSNIGMTLGAAAGFALPFVCNKFKLGKVFTKDLLLKVPVMTAGGVCAGGIAEGLTASTKKLQANNLESEMATQTKMDVKA